MTDPLPALDFPATPAEEVPINAYDDPAGFLEAHGYPAISPPIRSSDYKDIGDPFNYYLRRRLGLLPILSATSALRVGTWFHKRLEFFGMDQAVADAGMNAALAERMKELKEASAKAGIIGDSLGRVLEAEKQDWLMGKVFYEAASTVQISPERGTFIDFLEKDHWQVLGNEVTAVVATEAGVPAVIQMDLLLYHKPQNRLWILDAKTASEPAAVRLQSVPLEFQTQHYLMMLGKLVTDGIVQKKFDLPPDVMVGGMMHLAVQKPTIKFGMNDRLSTLDTTPFKSGPRKGQPRNEKVYEGEPDFNIYLERCIRWYKGEDEFLSQAAEWAVSPPVNISFTSATLLREQDVGIEYMNRLRAVISLAIRPAFPTNFLKGESVRQYGRLSPYAPFYMYPVVSWPEIIERESFVVSHRDDPSLPNESTIILPNERTK